MYQRILLKVWILFYFLFHVRMLSRWSWTHQSIRQRTQRQPSPMGLPSVRVRWRRRSCFRLQPDSCPQLWFLPWTCRGWSHTWTCRPCNRDRWRGHWWRRPDWQRPQIKKTYVTRLILWNCLPFIPDHRAPGKPSARDGRYDQIR